MDKFLLAENPLRPNDAGVFIIHLLDPIAIFICELDIESVKDGKVFKQYEYVNSEGDVEIWTFIVHHFFDTTFSKEPEKLVHKLMDKAWRWYRSYLEWEDKNMDNE